MHFGIFVEEMRYGANQVSAFRDAFELAQRAEDWGLDCVWLGEIHFTPNRSVISASPGRQLDRDPDPAPPGGNGRHRAPAQPPAAHAEEIATLDHISEGRLESGSAAAASRARTIATASHTGRVRRGSARRSRSSGRPGKASRSATTASSTGFRTRRSRPPVPDAASAHPDGRYTEETFPAVGKMGLSIFVGARRRAPRSARPPDPVPASVPRRAMPAIRASIYGSRSTSRRRSRARSTSPARVSRTSSGARPSWRARWSGAPAPDRRPPPRARRAHG